MLVVGDNGAGKTNLLEALHLATQGFSPRTRTDARLVREGQRVASVAVRVERDGVAHDVRVTLSPGEAKVATVDGARLPSAEALRRLFSTVVFTPDRLAIVKGGPSARRAYFDRVLARLLPARAALPQDYAATLAQRNAALRRVQLGLSDRAAVSPWSQRLAELGAALVAARRETLELLSPGFRDRALELGLTGATLAYEGEAPAAASLAARLDTDVARGSTGLGPHLHDVVVAAAGRDLRSFGSQGEQRLAVLSLLVAEAEASSPPPLVLLDDVLSELDARRRAALAGRVARFEQVVITATQRGALPCEPAQVVEVSDGKAV